MSTFSRTDTSVLGRWWWTVDRWTLVSLLLLMAAGIIFTFAASPPVADRIGAPRYHFVERQMIYLPAALMLMLSFSLLTPLQIRRAGVVLFGVFFVLTALTLVAGPEVKGATRWLYLPGFNLQPSEFLKPCFVVLCAWMFAGQKHDASFPGGLIAIGLMAMVGGVLVLQPDFGQAGLLFLVWGALFFMAGLPLVWIAALSLTGVLSLVGGYLFLPHVQDRIERFLAPEVEANSQTDYAREAFVNGGFFGTGPGEGVIKRNIPDAHSDYIFAVIGEEFGIIACFGLVALFAFVVLRGFVHLLDETDHFIFLAAGGLLTLFGLQAMVNIGVNLDLLPATGMTLPFISYGGSSLMALAMTMGMVLGLTRRSRATVAWRRM